MSKSRLLLCQPHYHQRQEAIIGILIMCLSTLFPEFLIQNIYSWQPPEGIAELLSVGVIFSAILTWMQGFEIYFHGFERREKSDITARNKGLIYGFGVANVSLVTIIIWPWISEGTSYTIRILPTYIGMVIGSL
jgi:hypothetical protein